MGLSILFSATHFLNLEKGRRNQEFQYELKLVILRRDLFLKINKWRELPGHMHVYRSVGEHFLWISLSLVARLLRVLDLQAPREHSRPTREFRDFAFQNT